MKTHKNTKSSEPVSMPVTTGGVERQFRMAEAAQLLGVSRATLYRWLPQIAHRRIPAGGLTKEIILIPASSLNAFLGHYDRKPEVTSAA
jgi:excisionase family DNA binding protein